MAAADLRDLPTWITVDRTARKSRKHPRHDVPWSRISSCKKNSARDRTRWSTKLFGRYLDCSTFSDGRLIDWLIDWIGDLIFCDVILQTHDETVAIKRIQKSKLTPASIENILLEIEILKNIKHDFIVEMKDFTVGISLNQSINRSNGMSFQCMWDIWRRPFFFCSGMLKISIWFWNTRQTAICRRSLKAVADCRKLCAGDFYSNWVRKTEKKIPFFLKHFFE